MAITKFLNKLSIFTFILIIQMVRLSLESPIVDKTNQNLHFVEEEEKTTEFFNDIEENQLDDFDLSDFPTPTNVDGDMILTQEQLDGFNNKGIGFRNGFYSPRFWPGGIINYVISNNFQSWQVKSIMDAMAHISSQTCLKFNKKYDNSGSYIFIKPGSGCSSHVGMNGGVQDVILDNGCFGDGYATVVHELLHAAGFFHEHNRQDRNSFVNIHWNNISPILANQYAFNINSNMDPRLLYIPYDFHSILHYTSWAFSKNRGLYTITTKKNNIVGQNYRMSKYDVLKVNRMYGCA